MRRIWWCILFQISTFLHWIVSTHVLFIYIYFPSDSQKGISINQFIRTTFVIIIYIFKFFKFFEDYFFFSLVESFNTNVKIKILVFHFSFFIFRFSFRFFLFRLLLCILVFS